VNVRALYPYTATAAEELSFKKDDVITNVQKQGGGWWKGDLGEEKRKWFPRDFVEEIEILESPFGTLQTGSVELGRVEVVKNSGEGNEDCPYILNIYGSPSAFRIGVQSQKEASEWEGAINFTTRNTTVRVSLRNALLLEVRRVLMPDKVQSNYSGLSAYLFSQSESRRMSEKKNKIAKELSELIVYACSVPKVVPERVRMHGRVFQAMSSFDETKGEKLMSAEPAFFVWLHQVSNYFFQFTLEQFGLNIQDFTNLRMFRSKLNLTWINFSSIV